jgi:hypothetical protein
VRAYVYLALVGAAFLLMLLPLRGSVVSAPVGSLAPQAVLAREGLYAQSLLPGESRTYVLEMAGHSLVKIRFSAAGNGLGLRLEDGEGSQVEAVETSTDRDRMLSVVNPAVRAQTLSLTVYRAVAQAHRSPLPHPANPATRFFPGSADALVLGGSAGAYALELATETLP